jgi:hypothetical protein
LPRFIPRPSKGVSFLAAISVAGALAASGGTATAEESAISPEPAAKPMRPAILPNRWQEDWSALADPTLRTEPWDNLKYIPLFATDPKSYVSFGATLRDRFESNNAPNFGVGKVAGDAYLIQRLQISADIHLNAHWQIFTEIEDDRAFDKAMISPADQDPLDLRLAFIAYTNTGGADPFNGALYV